MDRWRCIEGAPIGKGTVVAAILLAFVAATPAQTLFPIWNAPPGTGAFDATSASQRTHSFNPVTGDLIYVSRNGGLTVNRLNGLSGTVVLPVMPTNGITGGALILNASGVADDGVVYACNVVSPVSANAPLKVYRWSSENLDLPPVLAFSGDPGAGGVGRWSDAIAVRGSGPGTQILLSSDQNAVSLLTTTDGTNFTAKYLPITGGTAAFYQSALAFAGPVGFNQFWGRKSGNGPMYRVQFDPVTGAAQTVFTNTMPTGLVGIGFNPANRLFIGVTRATAATAQSNYLYQVSPDLKTFTLLDLKVNPTANGDGGAAQSAATFGNGRAYTQVANNGIVGWAITPFITQQPTGKTNQPGTQAIFTAPADGTPPFSFHRHLERA